jgi:hypothetical protein
VSKVSTSRVTRPDVGVRTAQNTNNRGEKLQYYETGKKDWSMREKSDIFKSSKTQIPYSGDYAEPIWTKDRD